MYIDSHTHYAHRRFDNNRDTLLPCLHANGLEAAVEAAISIETNQQMQETLEKYPWIYFSAGLHPTYVTEDADQDECWEGKIREALQHERIVAVGEAGLDYHRLCWETEADAEASRRIIERQKLWFHKLIQIAREKKLPLIIHTRELHEETIEILRQYSWGENSGVIHCFHGAKEYADSYIEMGFVLGIGGKATYDTEAETREVLKNISIRNIIVETDCPFLLPSGCEEKPNHSGNIPVIAQMVARQQGITVAEVLEQTRLRTKELFGISNIHRT